MAASDRTIAFLLYPGLTLLDLVGPFEVIAHLTAAHPDIHPVVVGERIEPMDTDAGVQMIPDKTFAEVPTPYALIVPGGTEPTLRAMTDPAIRAYVRRAAATADVVGSVCSGALILAAVGLLEGRPATTHWAVSSILERLGAHYQRKRWVEDGKFIMSAGVSAGIDMALYLVARLTDEATARTVQLAMDYDPQPPFGPIDWEHVDLLPRALRGGIGLAAPVIAARPKRLTRSERRGAATVPSDSTA